MRVVHYIYIYWDLPPDFDGKTDGFRVPMPKVRGGSWGVGRFRMGEVPLYSKFSSPGGGRFYLTQSVLKVFFAKANSYTYPSTNS